MPDSDQAGLRRRLRPEGDAARWFDLVLVPLLLGLGFELQRPAKLPAKPRDVPLWGIVTEHGVHGRAAARNRGKPAENGS
jgi:hypothetical protein